MEIKPTRPSKITGALRSAFLSGEHPLRHTWAQVAGIAGQAWEQLRRGYHQLDSLSGYRLSMIRRAFRRFTKNLGAESAASISFFTIFSVFPMMVFVTSAASMFLDSEIVKESVLTWLTGMLPVVPDAILVEIENVIKVRTTTVNLIALAGFLWSASGAFYALARSLNRVWNPARPRNALINRLFGLGMVASLVLIVMVLLMSSSIVAIILGRTLAFGGRITLHLVPILARAIVFWMVYRLVPGGKVNSMSALWGALTASIAWEINTLAFSWIIKSGFADYEFLYGSLGTIIAVLFWIFFSIEILLYGAYLAEADGYRKKQLQKRRSTGLL